MNDNKKQNARGLWFKGIDDRNYFYNSDYFTIENVEKQKLFRHWVDNSKNRSIGLIEREKDVFK